MLYPNTEVELVGNIYLDAREVEVTKSDVPEPIANWIRIILTKRGYLLTFSEINLDTPNDVAPPIVSKEHIIKNTRKILCP